MLLMLSVIGLLLANEWQVFTWGHRLVTPRRVVIARNLKKSGGALLKFHRMKRLHVVAIAAGMVHSMALTDDGVLFCWVSSDPDLKCQQVDFDYTCCLSIFFILPKWNTSLIISNCLFYAALLFYWEKIDEHFCGEVLVCCGYKHR